jgi:DNA repair exonuclease SbcCD nuclease subunit
MVRIGIFSDTHVGSVMPTSSIATRREAFEHAFREAINVFCKEELDYVIHAGDLFERKWLKPYDTMFVKEEFQRLIDAQMKKGKEVKIFVVRGNHDGTLENSALEFVRHPLARYLKVLGDKTLICEKEGYEDDNVIVSALSYYPYLEKKIENVKNLINENLKANKTDDKLRIFITHAFIEGYHSIPLGVKEHEKISLNSLEGIRADFIVCGHYHQKCRPLNFDNHGKNTTLITPGSTEPVAWEDEGPHGVYIYDSKKGLRFEKIKPLHLVKTLIVDSEGSVKNADWYISNGERILLEELSRPINCESGKLLAKLILKGNTDDEVSNIRRVMEQKIDKINEEFKDKIEGIKVECMVEAQVEAFVPPSVGGRKEYLEEIFSDLGNFKAEAIHLIEEVEHTLESQRSQTTMLLKPSIRQEYVKKWISVIEKAFKQGVSL